ncbi:L-lactate permease [Arachnia rubra]|jgi:transporter, lactate permease family|uniref:L-lactate permease n=1 Tax=Arachnia rubra TaxID=1547448 RepID=A0ABX7Y1P5_9ACTN|nr:L-lactate permease [Arachnia rubra]MBB1577049.1 L-lactate permease [Propionibacterium sp.]MDO4644601.1 L-lactate permease [Propionibacteriaceae bacterium]QUC07087.1 L-lactate permease [Arachnia rubra]BCR81335.1 L-lactate permease [Arachnia rubra]
MSSLLEVFQPSADPLGAQWLSALVAVIPIVCMLVTLGALRWKAHIAGAVSWALAFLVAILAFKMPALMAISTSIHGFVYGLFPIVWILLMAIWMYQVTVISGRFEDLRNTFFLISDDPRVLGLLIAFCFGGLLEALAGFGAPVAIAAAMLVAIGFSPIRSALIALLANTVPVAFGAVGLPVIQAAKVGGFGDDVLKISPITGQLTSMLCLVVPFLLLAVMDGKKGVKECWPFGLVVGVTFGIVKWIVSASPLYNLTELIAAVVSVGVAIVFTRIWRPQGAAEAVGRIGQPVDRELETAEVKVEAADTSGLTGGRIFMALVPYLLVIVVFGIAAIPAVKDFLKVGDVSFAWPGLSELMDTAGKASAHQKFTFQWASTPGILLAVVALLTAAIYRVSLKDALKELWVNVVKMKFAMLTIGSVVALAYVMGDSGQTLALGMFIAGAGAIYPFLAPVLGWIGTYVTGSDTSANILFSGLQSSVGEQIGNGSMLGVEGMRQLLVGANASGGVVGKMISPQSLAIAASAIGLAGSESAILRRTIAWSFILLFLLCLLAGLMSTPVLGWMVPVSQ